MRLIRSIAVGAFVADVFLFLLDLLVVFDVLDIPAFAVVVVILVVGLLVVIVLVVLVVVMVVLMAAHPKKLLALLQDQDLRCSSLPA